MKTQPPAHCTLCPRQCGANRRTAPGRCGGGPVPLVARCAPHHWEEPCISGTAGSGTVFFSGCALGCIHCQNHAISRGGAGHPAGTDALASHFLALQGQGVHNLNLVTATHYLPWVEDALGAARAGGLRLPVVWNTGGYERPETVERIARFADSWLFDVKYHSPRLSDTLCGAPDYFAAASAALARAVALAGPPVMESGLLRKGVILRLLVLPGHREDAKAILRWAAENLPRGGFLLSLMSQYTPPAGTPLPKPFNRRLSSFEYGDVAALARTLGMEGYLQQRQSADEGYLPSFEA